ncbi:hypothetical protein [Streptomyces sp. NPDC002265]|uniref:hypothetical protein n=1 Tax=Streptomyces sp. NPDC002265 TaxID=3154415 RepID=UPI00331A6F26
MRNDNARLLRGGPSRILAVLEPDLANPLYAAIIQGTEAEARRAGPAVLVGNSVRRAQEEARYRTGTALGTIAPLRLLVAETPQQADTAPHAHPHVGIEPELAVRQSTLSAQRRLPSGPSQSAAPHSRTASGPRWHTAAALAGRSRESGRTVAQLSRVAA